MKTTIKNFVGTQEIVVRDHPANETDQGTVMLTSYSGGLSFQFDMTPEQAVEMACALMESVGLLAAVPA